MKGKDEINEKVFKAIEESVGQKLKLVYNLSQAANVLLNSVDASLRGFHTYFDRQQKMYFGKMLAGIKQADMYYEKFADETLAGSAIASGDVNKIDGYRQDANELLRFAMLYVDRAVLVDGYDKIGEFMRALPEGGIFSEKDIEEFNFVAKCREE